MLSNVSLVASVAIAGVSAYKPCPLHGAVFDPPAQLSDSSTFQNVLHNLQTTLDNRTSMGETAYGAWSAANNSFSLGIFDTTSAGQLFSYQYSSPALQQGKQGVKHVTENSIYRIGSVSKLLTIYLFLIEAGPSYWNHPITEFVPALATAAEKCSAARDAVDCIDWTDITLGALASHMAGIPRDYSTPSELLDLLSLGEVDAVAAGLPPLPKSALPPCGLGLTDPCPENLYLDGLTAEQPILPPFASSPIYTNAAFELIEFALENITGKSIAYMMEKDVFAKLNMTGSSYYNPNSTQNAVIPEDVEDSYFAAILGNETPTGGIFSTQNDLAKLGQSILASTLLRPSVTRQWMKPVTFTSSIVQGVGMPWEIWRAPNLVTDHLLDLYTKSGDLGLYSTLIVLSPDYNVGFVVLVAGNESTTVTELISDTVAATIFPALERTAQQQAQAKYAGTYTSTEKGVDSKIELSTQQGLPGIYVDTWISNGTDITKALAEFVGDPAGLDIRLYPTGLVQTTGAASEQLAYRAVFETLDTAPDGGVFSPDCISWVSVDSFVYGNVGVDEFVFEVEDGKVTGLWPRAFRTTLKKIN